MLCGDDSDDEVAGPSQFARIATAASQAGFASEELELTLSGAPRDGSPSVAFCDLTYSIAVPAQGDEPAAERTILEGATGVFCARELTALMGPSGAGKTTLLNVLSGRLEGFTGRVATTGMVGALRVAYIAQEDVFLPQLTPSEHLEFLASLLVARSPHMHAFARQLLLRGVRPLARTPITNIAACQNPARLLCSSSDNNKKWDGQTAVHGTPKQTYTSVGVPEAEDADASASLALSAAAFRPAARAPARRGRFTVVGEGFGLPGAEDPNENTDERMLGEARYKKEFIKSYAPDATLLKEGFGVTNFQRTGCKSGPRLTVLLWG